MRTYSQVPCVEWCGDDRIKLDELASLVQDLQHKYGKKAIVSFNAGANNVEVMIAPTKLVEEDGSSKVAK